MGSTKGLKYRDCKEGEVADYFLVKELVEGYLDGIYGTYGPPIEYFVALDNPKEFESFDLTFSIKK
ncbi:MAG: hypothetical protein GX638_16495 [Crenarchaeota archaeon]|nr:hypothetical protein [Thermoproteota archaeon]